MTVFYPFAFRFFRPLNGYPLVYVFPNEVTYSKITVTFAPQIGGKARCQGYSGQASTGKSTAGMKVIKQCKMAMEIEKRRRIKLNTCPQQDIYCFLKCFKSDMQFSVQICIFQFIVQDNFFSQM